MRLRVRIERTSHVAHAASGASTAKKLARPEKSAFGIAAFPANEFDGRQLTHPLARLATLGFQKGASDGHDLRRLERTAP